VLIWPVSFVLFKNTTLILLFHTMAPLRNAGFKWVSPSWYILLQSQSTCFSVTLSGAMPILLWYDALYALIRSWCTYTHRALSRSVKCVYILVVMVRLNYSTMAAFMSLSLAKWCILWGFIRAAKVQLKNSLLISEWNLMCSWRRQVQHFSKAVGYGSRVFVLYRHCPGELGK
jgi:hypothetical protein